MIDIKVLFFHLVFLELNLRNVEAFPAFRDLVPDGLSDGADAAVRFSTFFLRVNIYQTVEQHILIHLVGWWFNTMLIEVLLGLRRRPVD